MYGIYANIWGILMVNVSIYIPYMDPMGYGLIRLINLKKHYRLINDYNRWSGKSR